MRVRNTSQDVRKLYLIIRQSDNSSLQTKTHTWYLVRSTPGDPPLPALNTLGNNKQALPYKCHLLHLNLIVFLINLIIKMEIKSLLLLKQIVPYNCALMVGSGRTEGGLEMRKIQDKNAF